MSRIGKLPIAVPSGVDVAIDQSLVTVKGPKGTLSHTVIEPITVERDDDGVIQLKRPDDERESRALHGLTRTLIHNQIIGVTEGYSKGLEIVGTGYRVAAKGNSLEFALGFSHSITVDPPAGISFAVEGNTKLTVHGIDVVARLPLRVPAGEYNAAYLAPSLGITLVVTVVLLKALERAQPSPRQLYYRDSKTS